MDASEPVSNTIKKPRRARNRKTKTFIVFDEAARREYLLGFQKRKNERRKKAKEENEKKIKEEKLALKQKARELIKKSDRHRVTEVEHLVDPTIFELPNHTVSVTDLADVDLGGLNGLGLGLNHGMLGNRKVLGRHANRSGDNSELQTPESLEQLKRKQKEIKHKLSQCNNQVSGKFKRMKTKGGHHAKFKGKHKTQFKGAQKDGHHKKRKHK